MVTALHPKLLAGGLTGFLASALIYELQKHNIYTMDGTEAGFLAVASTLVTGWLKKSGIDVPDIPTDDTPDEPPSVARQPGAIAPPSDPELDIPKPGGVGSQPVAQPAAPSTPPAPLPAVPPGSATP